MATYTKHVQRSKKELYLALSLYDAVEDTDFGHVKSLLVDNHADPNVILPEKGISPFHLIVGNTLEPFAEDVTKLFLQHHGNPNIRSVDGETPVHVAAVWGRTELLRLLLINGGDPFLRDQEGKSAFHYAHQEKKWDTVELLYYYCQEHEPKERFDEKPKFEIMLDQLTLLKGDVLLVYGVTPNVDEPCNTRCASTQTCECGVAANQTKLGTKAEVPKNGNIPASAVTFRDTPACTGENRLNPGPDFSQSSYNSQRPRTQQKKVLTLVAPPGITVPSVNPFPRRRYHCTVSPVGGTDLKQQLVLEMQQLQAVSEGDGVSDNGPTGLMSRAHSQALLSEMGVGGCGAGSTYPPKNCRSSVLLSAVKRDRRRQLCSGLATGSKAILDATFTKPDPVRKHSEWRQRRLNPSSKYAYPVISLNNYLNNLSLINCSDDEDSQNVANSKEVITGEDVVDAVPTKLDSSLGTESDSSDLEEWLAGHSCFESPSTSCSTNDSVGEGTGRQVELNQGGGAGNKCNHPSVEVGWRTDLILSAEQRKAVSGGTGQGKGLSVGWRPDLFLATHQEPVNTSDSSEESMKTAVSVSEEYRYTDSEQRVTLLERRLLVTPFEFSVQVGNIDKTKLLTYNTEDAAANAYQSDDSFVSAASTIPPCLDYDTDNLRSELITRGFNPGPITNTTKRVYLRKLLQMKMQAYPPLVQDERVYPPELQQTLLKCDLLTNPSKYAHLEETVTEQFAKPAPGRRWREGLIKSSFTYLLLDPRKTRNLPARAGRLSLEKTWAAFLAAVFYVGKGKRSRPYSHLYEAVAVWNKGLATVKSNKVRRIVDIWKEGLGVVCLHIFQNVIPVEAYTREAAMIDALGLHNLENCRHSEYYGVAATWTTREKRRLGAYLLYRAMCVFLSEGERQLRPADIG